MAHGVDAETDPTHSNNLSHGRSRKIAGMEVLGERKDMKSTIFPTQQGSVDRYYLTLVD